jgi:hypothetical protein
LAALPAAAGQINWVHQNGTLQSNGNVTIRAASGANYSATQNPGGTVAKANQNASTQPATILIQATAGGSVPLYLDGVSGKNASDQPESCPSGWTQIGFKVMEDATVAQLRRTCLPPENKSCAVLYLEGMTGKNASEKPEACPATWGEVGLKAYKYLNPTTSNVGLMKRACIKC